MTVELRWEGNDKEQWLFAGSNETELAWLHKRQKLWAATIWLDGIARGREYNTLAAHKKNIEEKVQHWFARALGDPKPYVVGGHESGRKVPEMGATDQPTSPTATNTEPGGEGPKPRHSG